LKAAKFLAAFVFAHKNGIMFAMTAHEIREKFLQFFELKNHKRIPSASLVPANDPTVLFTTAGMHPLVPFLMGDAHPEGRRLVDVQKCLRTDDIEEVGDETHLTFFEMLGNWSLGDYWKGESINWSYEFLTGANWLALDPKRLAVSVFAGDSDAPFDDESFGIWKSLGFSESRIAKLGKKDNWWGPPGTSGPCGPDTEIFYWTGAGEAPETFDPANKSWVEIWNNVFMQYKKNQDGTFEPLAQKNVDTGMGLERICAVIQNKPSIYDTDLFMPIRDRIMGIASKNDDKAVRVISDHIRAATFMIADGVIPSNKDRGYILRRLIRRAITYGKKLGIDSGLTSQVAQTVIENYSPAYPELNNPAILQELSKEETKFLQTLDKGLKLLEGKDSLSGKEAFDLFQTYGFPFELIKELNASVRADSKIEEDFKNELSKHQDLSRTASAGQFKGGLASHSEQVVKLHTATHLMNAALRKVLGDQVMQKGSNITEERTRFDFNYGEKMTDEQKAQVESLVNNWILADLTVKKEIMPIEEARKLNAVGAFGEKYGETVSIYTIFDPKTDIVVSREFCGGPHVEHTGVIGKFRIQKEEAVSAGVRRIKAVIE
jgi:alanyl-tRNA synthetase